MSIKKEMAVGVTIMVLLMVALQFTVTGAYKEYKKGTDAHKAKCLSKFNTIDYEVVNGELYCKSVNGLVKFK